MKQTKKIHLANLSIIGFLKRIVEKENARQRFEKLQKVYAMLSSTNEAIVRIRDLHHLCREVCRIAVEEGKFSFAWIGMKNSNSGQWEVVSREGMAKGFLKNKLYR
jgi:hypothetical protein